MAELIALNAPSEAALEQLVVFIASHAAEHDRTGTLPEESFKAWHAAGFSTLTVPISAGGLGAGLADACKVVVALGRGDPSVALVASQHYLYQALAGFPSSGWPDATRDLLHRSAVEEFALVNALRVEPELGTPARGGLPATVAHRLASGDGWELRGHKKYATGIPALRWLAVYARTEDPEPLVGTFLLDARSAGWRIVETWDHLGMRATASHDVIFEGALLPADRAIDLRPAGVLTLPDPVVMAWNNLLIAAVYHGVALAARGWLLRYLHDRVPSSLGASLATLPRFQEVVGRIEVLLHTSSTMLATSAMAVDTAAAITETALVKLTVTTNATDAVSQAVALVGNPGLSRHNPLERHLRDVLCSRIHTPQDDTVLVGAGRAALATAKSTTIRKDGR